MAATQFAQPAYGQPAFVPPGTAPVGPPSQVPVAAPGGVVYYSQVPGQSGGTVIVPAVAAQQPKYEYTPNDFTVLSLITVIMCGIFSPLSLFLSIPALLFSLQSKKNARDGALKLARKQGMIAAYLNITAIIAALLVACIAMGLVLGLYGPVYADYINCLYRGSTRNSYSYYSSSRYSC